MRNLKVASGVLFLLISVIASNVKASEIWILDCQGNPKISQFVESKGKQVLSLKINDATTSQLSLTSLDGSTRIDATVNNGVALFDGVSEGTWKLCSSDNSQPQISALTLLNQAETGLSYTELGFGTIAAGLAVVGFSFGNGGSDDSSSASNELLDSSSLISSPQPQQSAPQLGGASATNGRGECFVGNKVIPMSPFM